MRFDTLSCAQSLRVIGQHLDDLGNTAFEIYKRGHDYIVVPYRRLSSVKTFKEKEFLNTHTEELRRSDKVFWEIAAPIKFVPSEIFEIDFRRRTRDDHLMGMTDMRKLSSNLRALGGYLDRKKAGDFSIVWSIFSVKVTHYEREETLSVHQNLYDLGVQMYLKRSYRLPDSEKAIATRP